MQCGNARFFAVFALLMLAGFAYSAISLGDAVNFVSAENHFLYTGETLEQLDVPIKYAGNEYWLMPAISGNAPATYFAVKTKAKELETNKPANRALFECADTLREFLKERQRFSNNPQAHWLITSTYANTFETLGRLLGDEVYEMTTIATEMNSAAVDSEATVLIAKLRIMSDKCSEISAKINEARAVEAEFTTQPDTTKTGELAAKFGDVFTPVYELEDSALTYMAELDKLKHLIATSNADSETKTYLLKLASPPENFNNVGNYSQYASEHEQAMDAITAKVSGRIDLLLDQFDARLEMNKTWRELYGEDETVYAKTGQNFRTLKDAAQEMLSKDNKPYWMDQARLKKLEDNWSKAEKFFGERNYGVAINYAQKAKQDVAAVYGEGYVGIEPEPLISQETIFQIVAVLVVLLAVLYAISKRDRIMDMLAPKGES
ncbi:MAG: hypothetical protein V1676_00585 [Candidatus Diapherotrites archaeon]